MNLPESVVIGPFDYPVELNSDVCDTANVYGQIAYTPHRICLNPMSCDASRLRATLLHEVLHGIFDYLGLDHRIDNEHEESVITSLAPALLDTLQRNPRLVDFLMGYPE